MTLFSSVLDLSLIHILVVPGFSGRRGDEIAHFPCVFEPESAVGNVQVQSSLRDTRPDHPARFLLTRWGRQPRQRLRTTLGLSLIHI